jgi:hypothetical protein
MTGVRSKDGRRLIDDLRSARRRLLNGDVCMALCLTARCIEMLHLLAPVGCLEARVWTATWETWYDAVGAVGRLEGRVRAQPTSHRA